MLKAVALAAGALILAPLGAVADDDDWAPLKVGSASFRIGYFMPSGESQIWADNTFDLTYEVSDFNYFTFGFEINYFATRHIAVAVAIDYYNRQITTEYRDYVDDLGFAIVQDLSLEVVPITGTVKFMPLGNGAPGYRGERGSPIVPWVGGGAGVYAFRYQEIGEFIDFTDFTVFDGDFLAEGAAFGAHIAGGLMIPMDFDWDIFGEVRYAWVKADMGPEFLGFDNMDIGGLSFVGGASYRF